MVCFLCVIVAYGITLWREPTKKFCPHLVGSVLAAEKERKVVPLFL